MARARIPAEIARRVREDAGNRCGYCRSPQRLVLARLEIEHIVPRSKGGTDAESNLWLACPLCNKAKAGRTEAIDQQSGTVARLFNPREDRWSEHFHWSEDGLRIFGTTPIGRATVAALHLADDPDALEVRSYWILAGWHPPTD